MTNRSIYYVIQYRANELSDWRQPKQGRYGEEHLDVLIGIGRELRRRRGDNNVRIVKVLKEEDIIEF